MNIYLARQPIFDRRLNVIGYELLYRSGLDNYCLEADGEKATASVIINSFITIGIDSVTRGKKAFVNFSKQLLDQEAAQLFPPGNLVLEVIGSVEVDYQTLKACEKLKDWGYLLALDDFSLNSKNLPLFQLVDIVKIDFLSTDHHEQTELLEFAQRYGKQVLAKNVETLEAYNRAIGFGYLYFQGYFFCLPEIVENRSIPELYVHQVKLLQEIHKPEVDFDCLEGLIKNDVALSYKLLKFINTMKYSVRLPVTSIRQAMVMLGRKQMLIWATMITLHSIAADKSDELIITSMLRAHFCEALAYKTGIRENSDNLFLTGLFSLLDVFFDCPMKIVLEELPLSSRVKEALLGQNNDISDVYQLVLAYEKAQWDDVNRFRLALGLEEKDIQDSYLEAIKVSEAILD